MSSASHPSHGAHAELHRLAEHLSLPPSTTALARSILSATTSTSTSTSDGYFAACAIYVALASSRSPSALPLSALLSAAGGQLLITHFFTRAKLIAADASTMLRTPPPVDPAPRVHASHRAFMLSADIFRKLSDLVNIPSLLRPSPSTTRAIWFFFLVAKAHLTEPASPLPPVNAFHLLLACIAESGLTISKPSTAALTAATTAVSSEIDRYRVILVPALPPSIRTLLPLDGRDLAAMCTVLDSEYTALLASSTNQLLPDERVFTDAPHLLSTPESPPATPPAVRRAAPASPSGHPPHPPQPSPSRKRKMQNQPAMAQTPRTRADLLREKMSLTPRAKGFSRFMRPTRGADALDALAAVASNAPQSPAVSRAPRARVVPGTPMSNGCAAVSWLQRLADARPETKDEDAFLTCPPGKVKGTDALRAVIQDETRWLEIVEFVRKLSDKLVVAVPHLLGPERKREACAVFFAALENVLVKEVNRLKDKPRWIVDNLVKATSIHKSILLCSWEVTSAAYGRRDLTVFTAAITAFEEPPLDIIKAIESFVTLPDMPRPLGTHIVVCGNRVLESMAWQVDSRLVKLLRERATEKAEESKQRSSLKKENSPGIATGGCTGNTISDRSDNVVPRNAVREFTLEYFFRKLLLVASERAQELLIRLGMDSIAEPVWGSIKYAVWEKWHLMVDRHLDQVIMCCIYGVAKVRRYELKFREIIQAYQTMSHVREPSFSHMVPGVFRDVSLDSHLALMPHRDDVPNICRGSKSIEAKGTRGDIIKLYNQVFIHAMKAHILQFQASSSAGSSGIMSVRNLVGNSSAEGQQRCSSQLASATNSFLSGGQMVENSRKTADERRDVLNEKVMSSPMRMLRPQASPRRIGRVTVSPMSPGGRSLVAIRQSPSRRSGGHIMTPGTRKMYAFGESPVRSLDHINQSLAEKLCGGAGGGQAGVKLRSEHLDLDGSGVDHRIECMRKVSMRKVVENARLPRKNVRSHVGSVVLASASERAKGGKGGPGGSAAVAKGRADSIGNGVGEGGGKSATLRSRAV